MNLDKVRKSDEEIHHGGGASFGIRSGWRRDEEGIWQLTTKGQTLADGRVVHFEQIVRHPFPQEHNCFTTVKSLRLHKSSICQLSNSSHWIELAFMPNLSDYQMQLLIYFQNFPSQRIHLVILKNCYKVWSYREMLTSFVLAERAELRKSRTSQPPTIWWALRAISWFVLRYLEEENFYKNDFKLFVFVTFQLWLILY